MRTDPRIAAAEAILRRHGLDGAAVTAEGPEQEIAVLSVPAPAWEALARAAGAPIPAELRPLGFRYIALDLAPAS